jgi:hypothetical protein
VKQAMTVETPHPVHIYYDDEASAAAAEAIAFTLEWLSEAGSGEQPER